MVKAFVSSQLGEKEHVNSLYSKLRYLGIEITHDWTKTENLDCYKENIYEASHRAAQDLNGVIQADIYILMTNNINQGKGMYVELGAALAINALTGSPYVYLVGANQHESIFYYHQEIEHFKDIEELLEHIKINHIRDHKNLSLSNSISSNKHPVQL